MPAIWDRAFRERFYQRWGRESAVISASTRRAEYPDYTQLLSIKMLSGGSESYFVDGRRLRVDDDTFLILNAQRCYASHIDELRPVHSFSIFFRPGMVEEVEDTLLRTADALLARPVRDRAAAVEFDERLREHDPAVSPILRYIRRMVDQGLATEPWLEEQLQVLLARMLRLERRLLRLQELVPSRRPATREELFRRVGLGVSFIHTHFREPIDLRDVARAAHLSPFHFLRIFKAVHGMTPFSYLTRKRVHAALRLIRESRWSLTDIAEHVGLGCRTTLFRHVRSGHGVTPSELRSLAERERS